MIISCRSTCSDVLCEVSIVGRPVWPTASCYVKAYSKGVLGCWGQHRPGRASQPAQLVHWHGCQLQTASQGLWGLLCRPASTIQAPVSALQAALLLLDLQLGICADKALQALADAEPAASLAADIAVCKSRAAFLCGREEGGAQHGRQRSKTVRAASSKRWRHR